MEHILDLMEKGTSPYQAVGWGSDFLKRRGFQELDLKKPFVLEEGGRYFVLPLSVGAVCVCGGNGLYCGK